MATNVPDSSATGARHRPYHHGNLREALLDAADAMIESAGVHAISLRELGRAVGVSHTSTQRHFADRRDLLDALAQRGFDRLGAALVEPVDNRLLSFDERLTPAGPGSCWICQAPSSAVPVDVRNHEPA